MADETRRLDVSTADVNATVLKVIELEEQTKNMQAEITALKERVSALENA